MVCKLSILICTIPERKELFNTLYEKINYQIGNNSVQIIYDDAPKGTITIGAKRNKLLNQALGEYVVFIDDDDDIAFDYVDSILSAIDKAPDCIGFKIHCNMEGKSQMASASLRYKEWANNQYGFDYVRTPYHKTPIKRDIALKAMFPDKSFAEDHEYSKRVYPMLKSEIYLDKILYYYRYKYEPHATKYPQ
jgi:glycosyltransferase involved in cell wall biosynthesis